MSALGDSRTDFPSALAKHPGIGAFGVGRELKNLGAMLKTGEQLLDIIQGTYANQTGVLLHTTGRVIFFAKGITSTVVEEFALDKITSVQYSTGMMLGDIVIFASGNKAEIKNTIKAHTKTWADALREHMDGQKQPVASGCPRLHKFHADGRTDEARAVEDERTSDRRGVHSRETEAARHLTGSSYRSLRQPNVHAAKPRYPECAFEAISANSPI